MSDAEQEVGDRWLLARGPWASDAVSVRWRADTYAPAVSEAAEADRALAELADRGSPSHDGLAARMADFRVSESGLELELQPARWSLRLIDASAVASISALCVVRDGDGRWLAGRRAGWVASWAGRWALGAGGAVELEENPTLTLARELEEWSVIPERLSVEALIRSDNDNVLFVGQAWLADGAEVIRDPEHDAHAWWPARVEDWPPEAGPELRGLGHLLS